MKKEYNDFCQTKITDLIKNDPTLMNDRDKIATLVADEWQIHLKGKGLVGGG